MSAISIRLGSLRVERRLTQQQLAERVGVRRDTISALERGKTQGIEFDTLARLCDALDCTPNDLLELGPTAHIVPVLGGEDEDEIIAERIAEVDLAALVANPSLAALALQEAENEEDESPNKHKPKIDHEAITVAFYDRDGNLLRSFRAEPAAPESTIEAQIPLALVSGRP